MIPTPQLENAAPTPMLQLQAFEFFLAQALEEARTTLVPFSVMLLRVADLEEEARAMPTVRYEHLVRQLGLHVTANLRTQRNDSFPPRNLDVVSWWDHCFIALCHGTDAVTATIPAERVVTRVERIMPSLTDDTELLVRVAVWSWNWRNCEQSVPSIMQQLREELADTASPHRIEAIANEPTSLETKMKTLLNRFNLD